MIAIGQRVTGAGGKYTGVVDKLPDRGIDIPYVRVRWDHDPISYWFRLPDPSDGPSPLLASNYHQMKLFEL